MNTNHEHDDFIDDDATPENFAGEPPHDQLDALLRTWHQLNADRALNAGARILARAHRMPEALPKNHKSARPFWRLIMMRYSPIAAVFILLAILVQTLLPPGSQSVKAQDIITTNGGRLEIVDPQGNIVGSCPLKHTDVDVQISGRFTRVNLTQTFHNPNDQKIEAVYTFPMSHRAAVDRMTMTINDRVIVGEVKEREQARQIYEAAKEQGHVAGLLEQERPNIFTQSVANIEPGVDIDIRISYVETLESKDGVFTFDFPMVVGPRYVPGSPTGSTGPGTGQGFSANTNQVPDASRITPMPTYPTVRAGHDIGISVAIDTGGPGIVDLKSALHDIAYTKTVKRDDGAPRRVSLMLKKEEDIPNRDFVLSWRQTADTIQEATFTHTDKRGKFFTLMLQPPERVQDAEAVAREMIFVMDTSGSMSGQPIAKSRDVVSKCLAALRPQDTFNIITFSGDTHILWNQPRPGTADNIAAAQKFVESREGSGGTEMMKAIEAALVQTPTHERALTPNEMTDVPADGRSITLRIEAGQIETVELGKPLMGTDGLFATIRSGSVTIPLTGLASDVLKVRNQPLVLTGKWSTRDHERVFQVSSWKVAGETPTQPMRIACFFTDGYVGNDQAIVDAIQRNAKTTRVFSFGIGNSINRFLLDNMARAGRGEVEYVLLSSEADAAAERFTKRVQTPVLTDVELAFSSGLRVTGLCGTGIQTMNPGAAGASPNQETANAAANTIRLIDLFDVKPLILHGQYTQPGKGTLTIRGRTGSGKYERTLDLDLPADQPEHDTIATLWARAQVDRLLNQDLAAVQNGNFTQELHDEVVRLGETFNIMTQFTSFVAVEKQRITIGGRPQLVTVPIEMPQGVSYEGIFGRAALQQIMSEVPVNLDDAAKTEEMLRSAQNTKDPEKRGKELMGVAVQYQKNRQYDQAVKVLDEVLTVDQKNDRARFMKQVIEDSHLIESQKQAHRFGENNQIMAEEAKEQSPDLSVLNYSAAAPLTDEAVIARRDPFKAQDYSELYSRDANSVGGSATTPLASLAKPADAAAPALQTRTNERLARTELPDATRARSKGQRVTAGKQSQSMGDGRYYSSINTGVTESKGRSLESSRGAYTPALQQFTPAIANGSIVRDAKTGMALMEPRQFTTLSRSGQAPQAGAQVQTHFDRLSEKAEGRKPEARISEAQSRGGAGGSTIEHYSLEIGADNYADDWSFVASPNTFGSVLLTPDGEVVNKNYAVKGPVNEVAGELNKSLLGFLSWDAPYVQPDPATHQLIVTGKPEQLELCENLLKTIDTTTRPADTQPSPAESVLAGTHRTEDAVTARLVRWMETVKAANQLAWARSVLVPERIAILIGEQVKANRLDNAQALAGALATLDPQFKIGVQMRDTLSDAKLAPKDRDTGIAALADQARQVFDPVVRELKLRDRLDPRLYAFAKLGPAAATQPASGGITLTGNQLRVTVLATDTGNTTLNALRQAALTVEGTASPAHLVVGLIAPEKIGDLAVLDAVRTVVPSDVSDPPRLR